MYPAEELEETYFLVYVKLRLALADSSLWRSLWLVEFSMHITVSLDGDMDLRCCSRWPWRRRLPADNVETRIFRALSGAINQYFVVEEDLHLQDGLQTVC